MTSYLPYLHGVASGGELGNYQSALSEIKVLIFQTSLTLEKPDRNGVAYRPIRVLATANTFYRLLLANMLS